MTLHLVRHGNTFGPGDTVVRVGRNEEPKRRSTSLHVSMLRAVPYSRLADVVVDVHVILAGL